MNKWNWFKSFTIRSWEHGSKKGVQKKFQAKKINDLLCLDIVKSKLYFNGIFFILSMQNLNRHWILSNICICLRFWNVLLTFSQYQISAVFCIMNFCLIYIRTIDVFLIRFQFVNQDTSCMSCVLRLAIR